MEAIQTSAGAAGTAQSLFGKAAGATGKGGGLFAALLALVGRASGNAKEADQTGDGSANAAAGLQGLLALFNPAMANPAPLTDAATGDDQTLIGDSGSDPLAALASANGLDLSQLSDRNKLALLAQALADAKNADAPALPAGDGTAEAGFLLNPPAADRSATPRPATAQGAFDQSGLDGTAADQPTTSQTAAHQATAGQTITPADLDAILAELRARAAAKFGADNGKPALTKDGMVAALKPKLEPTPTAPASVTGPSQAPLVEDATNNLQSDAAVPAAPALNNLSTSPTAPVQPAVAAASFVSIEAKPNGDKPAENAGPIEGDESALPATDSESVSLPAPADGTAPPAKTPDLGTGPFQKVEVAPPTNAKPDPHAPIHPAPAADADKKTEPKSEPAATSVAADDQADKSAADDSSTAANAADSADSTGNSSSAANTAPIDPRNHVAARAPLQVPVEKLSQFLTQDDQLPLQIQRAVANGRDHIAIQIVPHDLGRIEIKLDFDRSGTINTVIAADRPQTLDLLKRDAAGLERALQDAGFKTDGSSLSFNLQSDQRQQYQNQQNNPGPAAWQSAAAEEAERVYRPVYRIASTADAILAAADGRLNIAV